MPVGPLSQPGASARVPTVTASVSASAIAGTVAGTAGGATISFTASDNPGKPSGNYVATSNPSGFTSSASVSPISFSSGVLAVGTAYTFSVVKQSGSGISSNTSTSSGSITAFTVPSAPVLTLTNTDNTVDWTWSSGGTGGSAITSWEYALSTNDGAFSAYTSVGAGTFSYPDINNYRNQNFYKLRVRAVNAAGAGPYTESANSTPWTVSVGVTTFSENSAPQACSSVFCGTPNVTCGSQAREQVKTRTVTRTTTTYTRGASSNSDVVDTAPSFDGIAYGACYNVGGCSSVGTSLVSGSNGQIVYVGGTAGQDYRIFDSFFGAWAVCNSGGAFTMTVASSCNGCTASCYVFSTSIQYCSVDGSYIPVGYAQIGACGFFCSAAAAC